MLDEIIGYVVVVFLITGFTYGFVRQIQHTLTIRKANKTAVSNYRRTLIGNYITCLSFGGGSNFLFVKRFSCDAYYPVKYTNK